MDLDGMPGSRPASVIRPGHAAWLGRWAAASLGLHGLLLLATLRLGGEAPVARATPLHVRLLSEPRAAEAVRSAAKPIPVRPAAPLPPRPAIRRLAVPSAPPPLPPPEREDSAGGGAPAPAPPPPHLSPDPSLASRSNGGGGGAAESPVPVGPPAVGMAPPGSDAPGAGAAAPGRAVPPVPPQVARARGLLLLPEAGQGGQGGQGSGVGDGAAGSGGEGSGSGAARAGGPGIASRGGAGSAGGGDGAILGLIRRRIEAARVYPDAARRAGMEGTVEVRFRIEPTGMPAGLEIVRSSGYSELDRASLETIRRAAPYPVVVGRIRVPLAYRLDR